MHILARAAILALLGARGVVANPVVLPPVSDIGEGLEFDENGKLASFYLVYPNASANANFDDEKDSKKCPAPTYILGPKSKYKKVPLEGEALKLIFPDFDENDETSKSTCPAAWLEKGTDRSVAGHTLPSMHYSQSPEEDNDNNTSKTFNEWFQENANKKEVCFINYYSKKYPVKVYWQRVDGSGEDLTMELEYGDKHTRCFFSFLGHTFHAYGKEDSLPEEDELVLFDKVTIEHVLVKAFGESPPHQTFNKSTKDFEAGIKNTLKSEWNRHKIPQRTFSPLGFAKGRLPKDVFASMGAFFYNNRHNKVREEWDGKGFFVNWWETDVFFIQIPWQLKEVYQIRLRDLVSEWAGTPVEQTVMYGLRQYESGARLLTHVDRLKTHAVSLIVNVAQGNLTQDWPVEVFDHHGRLHEVTMEPGDIVYYESAKNLHSRNRALAGADGYYVNMFTHYRPVDDGDTWYLKENQNDPVLEVEGDCISEDESMNGSGFGKVKCDDPRLGKNVSPTLFRAQSGDDLIQWWRDTTPGGYVPHDDGDEDTVVDEEARRRIIERMMTDDIPVPEAPPKPKRVYFDDDDDVVYDDDDDDGTYMEDDDMDDDYYNDEVDEEGVYEVDHDEDARDEL